MADPLRRAGLLRVYAMYLGYTKWRRASLLAPAGQVAAENALGRRARKVDPVAALRYE